MQAMIRSLRQMRVSPVPLRPISQHTMFRAPTARAMSSTPPLSSLTGTASVPRTTPTSSSSGTSVRTINDTVAPDEYPYRTQAKPIYSLPLYGASDAELAALSDEETKKALQVYGGLIREKLDSPEDWRERLRKATKSWHLAGKLTMDGVVVSNKMRKSVVVAVRRKKYHTKIRLRYERTKRFMAHDELDLCREGDRVIIRSCRPLSKRKAYVVVRNFGDKTRTQKDDRKIDLASVEFVSYD